MAGNIQVEDWPKFRDDQFMLQVPLINGRAMVDILRFVVMIAIKDGWQHIKVRDWHKFEGIWFLLQFAIFNGKAIAANIVRLASLGFYFQLRFFGKCVNHTSYKYPK